MILITMLLIITMVSSVITNTWTRKNVKNNARYFQNKLSNSEKDGGKSYYKTFTLQTPRRVSH